MSQRLQVLLDPSEFQEIRAIADRQHLTVAEWVRQALRAARREAPGQPAKAKWEAVQRALAYSYPTADMEQMNAETEAGYLTGGVE